MSSKKPCDICGEGTLTPIVVDDDFTYKGKTYKVPFHSSVCDCCGIESSDAADVQKSRRAVTAIKKAADGLFTGAQVAALRAGLGLTQQQAAKIFGGGAVAFSKYENDEVTQSDAMDKLLRVAQAIPQAFNWLVDFAGLRTSFAHPPEVVGTATVISFASFKQPVRPQQHLTARHDVERVESSIRIDQSISANDHSFGAVVHG